MMHFVRVQEKEERFVVRALEKLYGARDDLLKRAVIDDVVRFESLLQTVFGRELSAADERRRAIPRITQDLGERDEAIPERNVAGVRRAVMVRGEGREHRRVRRKRGRRSRDRGPEEHRLAAKRIERRRGVLRVAVAAEGIGAQRIDREG